ncbi:MAG: hypothetical protein UR28_C0012G0020 [Candidatus Peregrinibacteria bacterium GW2011_GWF2_33_10]|nr:MAG: hypothetical protein UR28_C0012G0020 [Candidatus Peregrinibacteria bacterium GW2011_GWF2_33_10]OGJ44074.1 MAG: hypothetical protein A2263_01575 [Candidatus Peregrinibacteria bacterium RIFOXYA2_FULL_33_21]OGJ45720.1 MAG: hypothetical protein A2272_03870 [Candidatus Peregrinibacteria bacterium RIFOXYA12_FULL_33_12]OGJ51401.1 MAG: hypothetical protein A2307_02530 [Candidatus Peregrinibacteria bacterium RIFOXYB2_FULL_33_20]
MQIFLKKFGEILTSRDTGKEAFSAFQPVLNNLSDNEKIEVDFEGVSVLTPSWADEFLIRLTEKFPNKVTFINTENASVQATLKLLKDIKFTKKI